MVFSKIFILKKILSVVELFGAAILFNSNLDLEKNTLDHNELMAESAVDENLSKNGQLHCNPAFIALDNREENNLSVLSANETKVIHN